MRHFLHYVCCLSLVVTLGCAKAGQPTERIKVWHWMTDRQEALETLARQYEEETGVQVRMELFAPSDIYSRKITAASQANVLPDIYGILDKRSIIALFIKSGLVEELTDEFNADNKAWARSFFAKALDVNRFPEGNAYGVKPGIYGVPIDVMTIRLMYNKDLLKKARVSRPPRSFKELLRAVDALKRVGITPFVSGFGETWLVDSFAMHYAFNIMGEAKVMATFRGEAPYTDPDWIKVFRLFQTLAEDKAFIDGIVTKGNKYAEQDFALGRAAFAFNGSWCVNVYHDMNPDLDYGVALLPSMKPGRRMKGWGGAGSSFVVNANSKHKASAIAFLKWLTAPEQQAFLAKETNNLPANKKALSGLPDILEDMAKGLEHSTHPSLWPLTEDPLVSEVFDKGIQAIIIGDKTPEEVAAEVQKIKEREMAKNVKR